ncbi:MAG TPA: hypothetical protein VFK52_11320 [Nocardioidaceae bacterium]|nr:hypothetical protein [Nocardioidaceae bacterium]
MTADATSPPVDEVRPGPSHWRRAVLAVALASCLAVLGWFWRHPEAFDDAGGWGVGSDSWRVNAPMYVGMSYAQPDAEGTVRIHSVKAADLSAPSDAVIEFFVCTIDPDGDASAIGAIGDPISDACASLVPAEGAKLDLDAKPMQQLVVAMTLPTPGRLSMTGVDVTYSYGWRRGTQRIGGDIDLKAATRGADGSG